MKFASLTIMALVTAWAGHAHAAKGGSVRRALEQLADQVESGEQGAIKGSRIALSRACRNHADQRLKQITADYESLSPAERAELQADLAELRALLESMPRSGASASPSTASVNEAADDRCERTSGTSAVAVAVGMGGFIALGVGLFVALPAGIRRLARRSDS